MTTTLSRSRSAAFARQSGHCFYCNLPMWQQDPAEFVKKYKITVGQAKRLQCTGEHLQARSAGGPSSQSNIVAACLFCNSTRHRAKYPLPSDEYRTRVRRLMNVQRWHERWVFNQSAL